MPDVLPAPCTRHDLLLVAMAVPLLVAGVVGSLASVPLYYALAAGSVPAGTGLGYALFYRPPVSGE